MRPAALASLAASAAQILGYIVRGAQYGIGVFLAGSHAPLGKRPYARGLRSVTEIRRRVLVFDHVAFEKAAEHAVGVFIVREDYLTAIEHDCDAMAGIDLGFAENASSEFPFFGAPYPRRTSGLSNSESLPTDVVTDEQADEKAHDHEAERLAGVVEKSIVEMPCVRHRASADGSNNTDGVQVLFNPLPRFGQVLLLSDGAD